MDLRERLHQIIEHHRNAAWAADQECIHSELEGETAAERETALIRAIHSRSADQIETALDSIGPRDERQSLRGFDALIDEAHGTHGPVYGTRQSPQTDAIMPVQEHKGLGAGIEAEIKGARRRAVYFRAAADCAFNPINRGKALDRAEELEGIADRLQAILNRALDEPPCVKGEP